MSIDPQKVDNDYECFLLSAVPNCVGNHCMHLTYGGYNLPGFPKIFLVSDFLINNSTVIVNTDNLLNLFENTIHEIIFKIKNADNQKDCKLITGNVVEMDKYENIINETPIIIKSGEKESEFIASFPVTSKNAKFINLFYDSIPFPGNPYPIDVYSNNDFTLKVLNNINEIYVDDLVNFVLTVPLKVNFLFFKKL